MVHRAKIQILFLTLPILTETRGFRIDHPLDMYVLSFGTSVGYNLYIHGGSRVILFLLI